ncbi:MAG: glycoside hydrolase family 127 protein [Phycisphaerae bacterium]|nr:glycoside hydrolase family 127 protein [Phycisphaerae bacterium]
MHWSQLNTPYLESIFWTYNRTGQEWLLDLAHRGHEQTVRWDEGVANWHGVNICQGFREPAQYFVLSQDRKDWDASERVYRTVMTLYGQVPGGMFGADENCRGGYHGPRQAAETCSMVEFMHSFEMLLGLSGDPTYADRCEDVAFNSLPAAMTPDAKALRYLTAPNMVRSDRLNKAPGVQNSGCMFAFSPDERYRCCQHNVSHGWPYYAEHLWMATRDNGLAAVLYAASAVTATVGAGDGAEVRIEASTAYPFEEAVRMRVSTEKPVKFPLYLRIPGWCAGAAVSVNGSRLDAKPGPLTYVRVEREWADGDTVEVELPMAIEVKTWETNGDSVSVLRGPLAYSLKIEGYWGTFDGTETWPNFELVPTAPWHYGLIVDETQPAASFEVVRRAGPLEPQPFKPEAAPIALKARGKRISNWQADYLGLVGSVPPSPVKSAEPAEVITLIPMGCTRLRISAFPRIGEGPDAREAPVPRPPRHLASVDTEHLNALSDGAIPARSSDRSIPRFTWWDHKGGREWVTYRFKQARTVSSCEVYWFDDSGMGACRVPVSWEVFYWHKGGWMPVRATSDYPIEKDRFNRVTFEPVRAEVLRLEVHMRDGFSAGILEWRVGAE